MNHSPLLSIIIPTYKEAGNIKNLVEEILEYCDRDSLEILVVDDNSQDGIDEQIRLLYEQGINITLLQRLENRGLATAVKFGMDRAIGKYLVCMDADLSHPPAVIPKMIQVLEDQRDVEVVVGSRYVDEGGFAGQWNQYRQWNSKISTMLANLVIHDLGVKDPMSGYFCIRQEVYLRAAYIKPIGYKILLELLVKCGCSRVVEVPITFRERAKGESKLNLREQMNYLNHLSRLFDFSHPQWSAGLKYLIVNVLGVSLMLLLWLILPDLEGVIVPVALSYLGVIATNVFFFGRYVHYNADQIEVGFPWISFTLITTAEYIFVLGFAFFVLNNVNMAGLLGLGALGALFRFMLRKLVGHDSRGPGVVNNYQNSFNYSSEEVSCLMCGNQNFTFPYIKTHNWLLECKSCGFRFAKRDVQKKERSISEENTKFHEISREEKKNNFEIYLEEIKKISEFKSLLIIGSDLEVSLGIARENCQEVKALEMNAVRDQTLQECWKELHSNIEIIIKENKFFDLVMILGELERIPNLQRFLLQLQKIMHKDSLVLITANNNDSENSRRMRERWYDLYNQNFWYFTLYDLNKLFRKNDFEIILLKEEERYRIRNFLKDFWRELYGLLSNVYTVDRNRNLLIARKNSMDYVKNFLFQNNS